MGCCLEWSCWSFLKQFDKTLSVERVKVKSLRPTLQESEKVLLAMKHINQINRKVSVGSFQLIVIKYHTFIIYINHISFFMSKRTKEEVRVVYQRLVDTLAEELAESLSASRWCCIFSSKSFGEKKTPFCNICIIFYALWLFLELFFTSKGPTCYLMPNCISCFSSLPFTTGSAAFLPLRGGNSTWINCETKR